MGQVLASDYVELYTLPADTKNDSQMNKSMRNSQLNQSKIAVPERVLPPKPKPGNVRFVNMEQIKALQVYISKPITNEFPEVTPDAYEAHSITDGHYYGNMPAGKRQGDGVLVLRSKPNPSGNRQAGQIGNVLMQEDHQYNYFGTYQDGQANGQGYAIFANDSACWGEVKQNQYNGKAIVKTNENNAYYGQWEERKLKLGHALTQHYYYVGSFREGMREGLGECQYHDGTIIKGVWKKDTLDMFAKIILPDRSEFAGKFYEGVKQGFGHLKTKDYEFYGDYDNNVKNGLGVLIEKREDPEPKNQFSQNLTKITESFYIQGVPQGLLCVTENNEKEWFLKNENQETEPLLHIHEKKTLAEIYDQESLENQKANFEREIKSMLTKVDEIVKQCEQFMVLEKQLDNQTQKLGQLTVYWDWIQETQQKH